VCSGKEVPLILLFKKQIGFALPECHATMEQIFLEMKKLVEEGAEIYPLLFANNGSKEEREWLEKKLYDVTGQEVTTRMESEGFVNPDVFDLMVIAPCPGNILAKLLNASGDPATMVKAMTHLQTGRPIVLALVANGNSGDLLGHIEQLLALKSIYFVPFGHVQEKRKQFIITRMDLIKETVVQAFEQKQIQPTIFEHHWFPS
jgi:dipicolinate synthase subunit B